jgi:hypothetical protein
MGYTLQYIANHREEKRLVPLLPQYPLPEW